MSAYTQREVDAIHYPIRYTQTPVSQHDPRLLERNRVLVAQQDRKILYAYKLLRTQVLQKMLANGWNTLAVISGNEGEGTTLTAVNLAISIALDPRYTALLIDMNLRNPSVHRMLGFEPGAGVSDVIRGAAQVSDILVNPGIEGLLVMPGRERVANSSELLTLDRARQIMDEVKSRYQSRIVVVDLPPLLTADDAVAFAPLFDAGLLVVGEGIATLADLSRMAELLAGKPVLGTVLNGAASD